MLQDNTGYHEDMTAHGIGSHRRCMDHFNPPFPRDRMLSDTLTGSGCVIQTDLMTTAHWRNEGNAIWPNNC